MPVTLTAAKVGDPPLINTLPPFTRKVLPTTVNGIEFSVMVSLTHKLCHWLDALPMLYTLDAGKILLWTLVRSALPETALPTPVKK